MDWMKFLSPLKLTSSARPELLANEFERFVVGSADLEAEGFNPLKAGIIVFTNHRILWIDENNCRGGFLHLASVIQVYPPKKSLKKMFSTPRINLQICLSSSGTPCPYSQAASTSSMLIHIALRNSTSSVDTTFSKLTEMLETKAWHVNAESHEHSRRGLPSQDESSSLPAVQDLAGPSRIRPAMAGVSGILRKEQEQWEETDKNLQDAFVDLKALMSKAKEMVALAEKMRAKLMTAPTTQAGSMDDEDATSRQEMQDWMLSVGIASPVTKETAGALYHQQLSRQIRIANKKHSFAELISPEDLLRACTLWEKIDVPVILRKFDSGVMIIQSKSQSDDEIFSRIRSLLTRTEEPSFVGIGATEVARALGMAPALAKEQLLAAEQKGNLCRDDGPDGLRFYLNFFKDIGGEVC
ncbi:hypothetical protein KP509_07G086800 [Ceratopteris richardii]|uniref:Vacuolar protein-sorting-associated protein 36 n=1 Tax=Ceratopteris richardii TaxID=49495 RepID=A0A8T2UC00_CERRI|nr:hypothetical protein KP509_07G086800 [Ceratopteris richardii]